MGDGCVTADTMMTSTNAPQSAVAVENGNEGKLRVF